MKLSCQIKSFPYKDSGPISTILTNEQLLGRACYTYYEYYSSKMKQLEEISLVKSQSLLKLASSSAILKNYVTVLYLESLSINSVRCVLTYFKYYKVPNVFFLEVTNFVPSLKYVIVLVTIFSTLF